MEKPGLTAEKRLRDLQMVHSHLLWQLKPGHKCSNPVNTLFREVVFFERLLSNIYLLNNKILLLLIPVLFLPGCQYAKRDQQMKLISGIAAVNDTKLYYEVMGEGHPLVFVHGGLVDSRMWDRQFEFFSKHFKVIRYDFRGFGRSAVPTKKSTHAQDLYCLLKFLDIENTYIVGLSMGGAIAIDFTLEHPEMVTALIPATSALSGYKYPEELMQKGIELYSIGKEEGNPAAIEVLFSDPFWAYTAPPPENAAARQKYKTMVEENSNIFKTDPQLVENINPPAIDRLPEIKIPTLIITSDKDYRENISVSDLLVSKINGAKKIVIPGCGHMVNMENPEVFNKTVYDFLISQ